MHPAVKQVLGVVAILSLVFLLLWKVPEWQVANKGLNPKDRIELENNARTTLAQILGGAALLLGLFFTWRTVKATEQNLRLAKQSAARNLEISHETLRISQEGQITERFTRAIEQLGSDKLWIRLGGIYALERIARDSDEKDHWTVMEVLTAYVRDYKRDEASQSVPIDVQAILTVLGRRTRAYKEGEEQPLDLSGGDLRLADLTEAPLQGANLRDARLEGANLRDARLEGAFLRFSHLEKANLGKAHLEGADLVFVHLEGVSFREAHLEEAVLVGAHLEGADLQYAIGLTKEQIESAIIDENTKLPDYLKVPGHEK